MRNYFEWFQTQNFDLNKLWLIFGKGPSFSERGQFDIDEFYTLSLNHAVREQNVIVAHMIDFDVVDACGEAIEKNAEVLVMPWQPHFKNTVGPYPLDELVLKNSILRRMDEAGRLLWYNLSTATRIWGGSPIVPVKYFSAEAALNLLALSGVRKIRSLGIDGGATYSSEFDDLKDKTLLANKWKSFNRQFEEIAKIIMKTGIDYSPLNVENPIRVYVASTEKQMLSVKVLEYSIRKHASMCVEVYPLHLSNLEIPTPKDIQNYPRTPFSFQRFIIPEYANYKSRAIYLDSDMQVFRDIRDLWALPFSGADLLAVREPSSTGRRPQFSVMLLNCASLKWNIQQIIRDLNTGQLTYEQLMYDMAIAKNIQFDIDSSWNSLEQFKEGETALIHYTDMDTQPWVSRDNPLGFLWMRDLFEAIDTGFISMNLIHDHVSKGYIRPSLLYQITHRIEDSLLLSKAARLLDKDFIPPFRSIHKHGASPWMNLRRHLRAIIRTIYQKSPIFRLERKIRNRFKA